MRYKITRRPNCGEYARANIATRNGIAEVVGLSIDLANKHMLKQALYRRWDDIMALEHGEIMQVEIGEYVFEIVAFAQADMPLKALQGGGV